MLPSESELNYEVGLLIQFFIMPIAYRMKAQYGCYDWDDVWTVLDEAIAVFLRAIDGAGRDPLVEVASLRRGNASTESFFLWLNCLHDVNRRMLRSKTRRTEVKLECVENLDQFCCDTEEKPYSDQDIGLMHEIVDEVLHDTKQHAHWNIIVLFIMYDGDDDELREAAAERQSTRHKVAAASLMASLGWGPKKWFNEKRRLLAYLRETFITRKIEREIPRRHLARRPIEGDPSELVDLRENNQKPHFDGDSFYGAGPPCK